MRLWLHLFHTAPTPPLLRDTGTPIFSGATSISPSHPYFSSLCSYPIQRRLFISSSSQDSQPASQPTKEAGCYRGCAARLFTGAWEATQQTTGPFPPSYDSLLPLCYCWAPASTRHRLPNLPAEQNISAGRGEDGARYFADTSKPCAATQRMHVSNWVIREPGTIIFATILGPL